MQDITPSVTLIFASAPAIFVRFVVVVTFPEYETAYRLNDGVADHVTIVIRYVPVCELLKSETFIVYV